MADSDDLAKLRKRGIPTDGDGIKLRILFVCQKCGEEVGEGEEDRNHRHQNCGGSLDPIGQIRDEDDDDYAAYKG